MTTTEPKSKRGGSPVYTLPDPIEDATPEAIADVVMRAPPKKKWRYLEERRSSGPAPRSRAEDRGT